MPPAIGFHGSIAMAAIRQVRGQPLPKWEAGVLGGTFRRNGSVSARSQHQRSGLSNKVNSPDNLRRFYGSRPPKGRDNDMEVFWRHILAWDPNHTRDTPPHHPKLAGYLLPTQQIPTTFRDVEHYRTVMMPFLFQEVWAQIKREANANDPISFGPPISFAGPLYFPEPLLPPSYWYRVFYEPRYFDDYSMKFRKNPREPRLNDADLVVLGGSKSKPIFAQVQSHSHVNSPSEDLVLRISVLVDQPESGPESVRAAIFPEVESHTHFDQTAEGLFLKESALVDRSESRLVSAPAQCHSHFNLAALDVFPTKSVFEDQPESGIKLYKCINLRPALYEFRVFDRLDDLHHPAIFEGIVKSRVAVMPDMDKTRVQRAKRSLSVNESQARAILGAMSDELEGFVLIQGPPGTGKTKTIIGLVSRFLATNRKGKAAKGDGDEPPKNKLLVCAQSNAAIDEVCKRLMKGVPRPSGGLYTPTIVRLGEDGSINEEVKRISMTSLTQERVPESKGPEWTSRMRKVGTGAGDNTKTRTSKWAAKDAIVDGADIICTTLSGASSQILQQYKYRFETVIIDEAAQATELSSIIPLRNGCKRCILIGDHNQLEPLVLGPNAERFGYNQSLFGRLAQQNPANIQLLSVQYRMHPDISKLPSKLFYDGRIEDGPNMAQTTAAVWHVNPTFGPYRFFNVKGVETKVRTSPHNLKEVSVAIKLYRKLEGDFGSQVDFANKIGVIAMYKQQLEEMKRAFVDAFGQDILKRIDFNTVDGFQGREKDIIILSCVRSGSHLKTVGFLDKRTRMNVALTRAKSSLFVIGDAATLERCNEDWKTIVNDAREHGFLVDYDLKTFSAEAPEGPV